MGYAPPCNPQGTLAVRAGPDLCQPRAKQPAGLRATSRYRVRSCRVQGDAGAIYRPLDLLPTGCRGCALPALSEYQRRPANIGTLRPFYGCSGSSTAEILTVQQKSDSQTQNNSGRQISPDKWRNRTCRTTDSPFVLIEG